MAQPSDRSHINAVVCIPTFRRPDWLSQTLASLSRQTAEVAFAIVVVDNDPGNPAGARTAEEFFADTGLPNAVFIESNQGNCFAINRAFGEALKRFPEAEFFLMIDDDEVASADWLANIVETANQEEADIVGGPVLRQFLEEPGDAVKNHQLFVSIDGPSRQLEQIHGSGNCLIRRGVFETLGTPIFDLKYNFLGGGDMDFFTRCRKAGFKTCWSAQAIIHEFVPRERTSPQFLMTRSIRTGSINYVVDRSNGMPASKAFLKNLVSLALGIGRSATVFFRTGHFLPASHPFLVSLGRMYAALGFLPEPYKDSEKT
ncbi:glycosyltransferase family 2 protein [Roseibium sp. SCP14]|uniref:glycosyltransferase family 2 protein n=1 Tax=Roseibium sp. SCP14 TaxID=3141375 RepID=UPI00333D960C